MNRTGLAKTTNRCLYDVLLELVPEFGIFDNQLYSCKSSQCSGTEPYHGCFTKCNYEPEKIKENFRKALLQDDRRDIKKRNDKIQRPRKLNIDLNHLCGDSRVDSLFLHLTGFTRKQEIEESEE